jgi:hypothetical protein
MKQTAIPFCPLLFAVILSGPLMAQQDSTRLDAGYLSLKKAFTQQITIKGSDLEKMPFTNLSDAIGAWLYGAYTTTGTVKYIVDGNPVTDVNIYSVHDIEEVVLVQNAAVLTNTAGGQQEMVLIRTKHGSGLMGIVAAAQAGLVDSRENGMNSKAAFYHDYYLGAWKNLSTFSFGVSGDFQRDVIPVAGPGVTMDPPRNLERWRLNGYFSWRPNVHNTIGVTMNYTPEKTGGVVTEPEQDAFRQFRYDDGQHFIQPALSWHSELPAGWTNDLMATYLYSRATDFDIMIDTGQAFTPRGTATATANSDEEKSKHYWVLDRLGYRAASGRWSFEPAINFTYEHFNEGGVAARVSETFAGNYPGLPTGTGISQSSASLTQGAGVFAVTPVFEASFGRALELQGGAQLEANRGSQAGGRVAFPFASVTLDLLRLGNEQRLPSLKVYGSYAQRTNPSPEGYRLADLTAGTNIFAPYDYSAAPVGYGYVYLSNGQPGYPLLKKASNPVYWVWETGVSYSAWNNRLQVQYTFEQRNLFFLGNIPHPIVGTGPVQYGLAEWRSSLQHLDVRVEVIDSGSLSWQTGFNLTSIRNKGLAAGFDITGKLDIGDDYPNPLSWSGGWVNRFEARRFSAGLDLLYHIGEPVASTTANGAADTIKVNSVILPNVYVGYRYPMAHSRSLELFIESRGLLRNAKSDLLDSRRYFTLGGKFSL